MIKVQFRRVSGVEDLELLNSMSNALLALTSECSLSGWNEWTVIGTFLSIDDAIEKINDCYGLVVKKQHLGCDVYWFQEHCTNQFMQIRFYEHGVNPWKIGLNDHD